MPMIFLKWILRADWCVHSAPFAPACLLSPGQTLARNLITDVPIWAAYQFLHFVIIYVSIQRLGRIFIPP